MALYEYQSDSGDIITVERPMTEAPKVGHTIRRGGEVYRRIISTQARPLVSKVGRRSANIQAWSLPPKDQMDPGLHKYVDGWNDHGVACFSSQESAERYAGATRDAAEKAGEGNFVQYGDGPSGTETQRAYEAGKKVKADV